MNPPPRQQTEKNAKFFKIVKRELERSSNRVMGNFAGQVNEAATTQYVYNQLNEDGQFKGNTELAQRCTGYSLITGLDQKLIDHDWSGPLFDMLGYKLEVEEGEVLSVTLRPFDFKSSLRAIMHLDDNDFLKALTQIDPTVDFSARRSIEQTIDESLTDSEICGADALSAIFRDEGHCFSFGLLAYEGNVTYEKGAFIVPNSKELESFGLYADVYGNEIDRGDIIAIPQTKARKLSKKVLAPLVAQYSTMFGSELPKNEKGNYGKMMHAMEKMYKVILLHQAIGEKHVRFGKVWDKGRSAELVDPERFARHVELASHYISTHPLLASARGNPYRLIDHMAGLVASRRMEES